MEPHAPKIDVRLKTMRKLREAGIYVYPSLAPVTYCHPKRFSDLFRKFADRVYVNKMAYDDKTDLKDMPKARA